MKPSAGLSNLVRLSLQTDPDARFSTSGVFHQSTPPRPLIHRLKPFSIRISIHRENRLCNRRFLSQQSQSTITKSIFCDVLDSAETCTAECDMQELKGISIKKTYIGQLSYTIPITFTHKKWGLTRDSFLSQQSHRLLCDKNRRLQSLFPRRILIHIEKGFKPCLRGLGGVVWWKKPEVENLVSGFFKESLIKIGWKKWSPVLMG
jgi:hypothetical protein